MGLEASITEIDLSDTRLKFRRNFIEGVKKAKSENIQKVGLPNPVIILKQGDSCTDMTGCANAQECE
jgi:hypothetical protein